MAFKENFDAFLAVKDFGIEAVYTDDAGNETTIAGIFDNEHLGANLGEVMINTTNPVFMTKTANVVGEDASGTLTADGKTYDIVDIRPDGTGMTLLVLSDGRV